MGAVQATPPLLPTGIHMAIHTGIRIHTTIRQWCIHTTMFMHIHTHKEGAVGRRWREEAAVEMEEVEKALEVE